MPRLLPITWPAIIAEHRVGKQLHERCLVQGRLWAPRDVLVGVGVVDGALLEGDAVVVAASKVRRESNIQAHLPIHSHGCPQSYGPMLQKVGSSLLQGQGSGRHIYGVRLTKGRCKHLTQ